MIGVFDSGSGGVSILSACRALLPNQNFLYLGDHANAPYGHRSNEQIVDLTTAGVDALMKAGCDLVILACNTAAAVALRTIQQNWLPYHHPDKRVLGVLVPMVEALTGVPWSQQHPNRAPAEPRTITLFATRKTVESNAYNEEIGKRAPEVTLFSKACPGLVDAIEGGTGPAPLKGLISGYVEEALACHERLPDAIVLGCTHFPFVKKYFRDALPSKVAIYEQPEIVASALKKYLSCYPHFARPSTGSIKLLTTGNPQEVTALNRFLPKGLQSFEKLGG